MKEPRIDDSVRLTQDIPELALSRDDVGIVRSTWFAPFTRYEVEFERPGQAWNTRALLRPEQVKLEDDTFVEQPDNEWVDQVGV